MKRLLLAGLLILPLALSRPGARAEQGDAYGSLVGMADVAGTDKGPDAGEMPRDTAGEKRITPGAPSGETIRAEYAAPRAEAPAKRPAAPAAKREAARDDDAPSVVVPAPGPRRVWTRLFASLVPSMRPAPDFEVNVSTGGRLIRPVAARPATEASVAGSAQGLLEFVAVATAPSADR